MKPKTNGGKAPVSKVKIALAGLGACFCVAFAVWGVMALAEGMKYKGPSELALSPNNQDEVLSKRMTQEMRQKLNLTDDQTAEIGEIVASAKQQAHAFLAESQSMDRGQRFLAGRQRMIAVQSQVESVLSDEQKTQFRAMVNERRGKMFKAVAAMAQRMQSQGKLIPGGLGAALNAAQQQGAAPAPQPTGKE